MVILRKIKIFKVKKERHIQINTPKLSGGIIF